MNRLCFASSERLALSSPVLGRADSRSVSDDARAPLRRWRGRLGWWQALVVSAGVWASVPTASAATYVVTTTANNGAGSLRAAIRDANANPGVDRIEFAIPGAVPLVITPTTALPEVTDPVTIDGYTQAGSAPASALGPAFMGVAIDAVNVDSGLEVLADGCTIRGLAIMNPDGAAIVLAGDGNLVEGNHLGADAAGGALASGTYGVTIAGTGNVLGGPAPEQRNVITGYYGVYITSGGANRVEGNWIGLDSGGNPGFGQSHGVQIDLSDANEVVGNVISDYFVGMEVWGDRTVIQGNRIGTDPTGLLAIPNGLGVNIEGGDENQIGGTGAGEGNLISGNPIGGVQLEGGLDGAAVGNVLEGNTIGLDATGTVPMPNGTTMSLPGISLVGAQDTTVGGTAPGSANVVSGNDGDGIRISSDGSGNRVLGNRIGTDRLGLRVLGNVGHGVSIDGSDNWVGDGSGPLAKNLIAHNGGDGVWVEGGTSNRLLENVIFHNGGLGIDLGPDGRSGEDPAPDADVGANDAQSPPVLTVAVAGPVQTPVEWQLASTPSQEFRVDFYWSLSCDPTGFGEGFIHLGTEVVTTNAAGKVKRTFTAGVLPVGTVVTATATPQVGGAPTSTSEFSECKVVTN